MYSKMRFTDDVQRLLCKRANEGKTSRLSQLIGHFSDNQKRWFASHYKLLNTLNLATFIHDNQLYFSYDNDSGYVTVNEMVGAVRQQSVSQLVGHNDSTCGQTDGRTRIDVECDDNCDQQMASTSSITSSLEKPLILEYLESNRSSLELCLNARQKLSAIDIIVFSYTTLKYFDDSMNIKDFFALLKEQMRDQLREINCKQEYTRDANDCDCDHIWVSVANVLRELRQLFTYDASSGLISIDANRQRQQDIENMLIASAYEVIKNYLIDYFKRFGRQTIDDMEDRLKQDSHQLYHYLIQYYHFSVVNIANRFPNHFVVMDESADSAMIDVRPSLLNDRKKMQFKMMYDYGKRLNGMKGEVTLALRGVALIVARLPDSDQWFEFTAKRDAVNIIADHVLDNEKGLKLFLHKGDRIEFNAKIRLVSNETTSETKEYGWYVTDIVKVFHCVSCFVSPFYSRF